MKRRHTLFFYKLQQLRVLSGRGCARRVRIADKMLAPSAGIAGAHAAFAVAVHCLYKVSCA